MFLENVENSISKELDNEVWDLIDTYGFRMVCDVKIKLADMTAILSLQRQH